MKIGSWKCMLGADNRCLFSCKRNFRIFGDMWWIGVVLERVLTDVSATRGAFGTKCDLNMGWISRKKQSNIKYLCGGDTVGSSWTKL